MYRYKRILVGISLEEHDGTSIRYAAMVSRLAQSEKVTFLHVSSSPEIDDEVCELYPELQTTCDGATTQKIEALVNTHFDGHPDTRLVCEAVEGSVLIELLRRSKSDDVDLIIMRKKAGPGASGSLSKKRARKAPCSLLFVPEAAETWYKNILVAVDFSENAKDALEVAVTFARANGIDEVDCLNVYDVPAGYYKTGKSFEQFAEIMKGHAQKRYEEFVREVDLKGITAVPRFKLAHKEHRGIWESIINEPDVHLLVMGAKGRKAGLGVLLGSVTERLIETTSAPLLAVKRKGAGMGFLDALLKL